MLIQDLPNMKVAICFYGLVGSKSKKYGIGENLDPKIAFQYYQNNVFKHLKDFDVFIHSQSFDEREKLIELYKPKAKIIEKQKFFLLKTILHSQILWSFFSFPFKCIQSFNFRKSNIYSEFILKFKRCLHAYSRWYSIKQVINLKRDFENNNNFKYDLVFLTRLDLAFLTAFDFSKIDNRSLTVPNHNDVPTPRTNYKQKIELNNRTSEKGISDFWFIASSQNIDKFSTLFDRFKKYNVSNHISSFQHAKYLNLNLKFYKFRGLDHEAVRRLKFSEE